MYSDKDKEKHVINICKDIAQGQSIRNILKKDKYPSAEAFYKWIKESPVLNEHYMRARVIRAEVNEQEQKAIADDKSDDYWVDDKGVRRPNNVAVSRAALQISTRQYLSSVQDKRKYGKQIDLTSDGEKIQQAPVIIHMDGEEISDKMKLK